MGNTAMWKVIIEGKWEVNKTAVSFFQYQCFISAP